MPAPWCRDYGPPVRITDQLHYEFACMVSKRLGDVGRLLNFAEWDALLGAPELRKINLGAELMKCRAWR